MIAKHCSLSLSFHFPPNFTPFLLSPSQKSLVSPRREKERKKRPLYARNVSVSRRQIFLRKFVATIVKTSFFLWPRRDKQSFSFPIHANGKRETGRRGKGNKEGKRNLRFSPSPSALFSAAKRRHRKSIIVLRRGSWIIVSHVSLSRKTVPSCFFPTWRTAVRYSF